MLEIYNGKKVYITGHTGFKGSWFSAWLKKLGAEVKGYSLNPNTNPNHFDLLNLDIQDERGDIRNKKQLEKSLKEFEPDIIFHLAAQPLVKKSYEDPFTTFDININGTINLLEACKSLKILKAINIITTDKVYKNFESVYGYRENDELGGIDPYSCSKSCVELIVNSYRESFFRKLGIAITTSRCGNVIGGGDWSNNRIMTDIIKSYIDKKELILRSPESTRPFTFILDSLYGYLKVGEVLLNKNYIDSIGESWNFSPDKSISVEELVNKCSNFLPIKYFKNEKKSFKESIELNLDNTKAKKFLNWECIYDIDGSIERICVWYKNYYEKNKISTFDQIQEYENYLE